LAVATDRLLGREPERPLQAGPLLPAAGDEAGAGRRADGGVGIEVGAANAFDGESVDMGRFDVEGAVRPGVGVAEIVDQDEDDVGAILRAPGEAGGRDGEKRKGPDREEAADGIEKDRIEKDRA
jgi:hypothetical protein